jgi:molybdenum cofactor synthesis domain-containing protein
VLAGVGRVTVVVTPRPVVGVFSTGDELVAPGEPLAPGQIRDSNRLALLAALAEAGVPTVDLGLVADDEAAIADTVTAGVARCDAVVTSGGVSMGDFDFVKVVLDRLGEMRWMQVAIKPAKPLAFGTVRRPADGTAVPVFGLPGNPVSSLVSFELFARPGLRRMAGHADGDLDRPRVRAVAAHDLRRRPDGKTHFVRVTCRWDDEAGGFQAASAGAQGSHQLTAFAAADALVELPDGHGAAAGDVVVAHLLR